MHARLVLAQCTPSRGDDSADERHLTGPSHFSPAEIPSDALAAVVIDRIGRHNSLAIGILVGGISCLICSFCPPGAAQVFFATAGKFGCAGAFTIAAIFTSGACACVCACTRL